MRRAPSSPALRGSGPSPADPGSSAAFETLLARISRRFITLPLGAFDSALIETLEEIGQLMEADRCFVFLPTEERAGHRVAHVWTAREIPDDPVVKGTIVREGFPWVASRMNRHVDIVVASVDDLPPDADHEVAYCRKTGIQSFLMCPMYSAETVVGILGIDSIQSQRSWTEVDCRRLRLCGEIVAAEILRQQYRMELQARMNEVRALKERLEAENQYLRREALSGLGSTEIVAESPVMRRVMEEATQVATTDSTVLLLGETGTGKELLARTIHLMSSRRKRPLVAVNCAALSPSLIENELFGREQGAYTGAVSKQPGRFEVADGSTLFLDEVGELPLEVQAKLLRVLQSGELERLGSSTTRHVDVRLVAATNRDLGKAVHDGSFREDLFYRLNVFPIRMPALRERREDVPSLVWAVVRELEGKMARRIETVPDQTMAFLCGYPWPGNVRELRNVVERAMILSTDGVLRVDLPDTSSLPREEAPGTVRAVEADHIRQVLVKTGWRVRGARGAAEILGLKPTTLESRMKKLGIRRP